MKEIKLDNGMVALVDDADFARVSQFKWRAVKGHGNVWYAQTTFTMHELIKPVAVGKMRDHKNGDGLDNRQSNLRECSNSQNQANRKKINRPTQSRYKGVNWGSGKSSWRARIRIQGLKKDLGTFSSEEAAARAYDEAAVAHFGEFAVLNFPNTNISNTKNY